MCACTRSCGTGEVEIVAVVGIEERKRPDPAIHGPEVELRVGVSLLGGETIPPGRVDVVLRDSAGAAVGIYDLEAGRP